VTHRLTSNPKPKRDATRTFVKLNNSTTSGRSSSTQHQVIQHPQEISLSNIKSSSILKKYRAATSSHPASSRDIAQQHQVIQHPQEISRSNMKLLFILFTAAAAIASVS
jgi:hypothetical protein